MFKVRVPLAIQGRDLPKTKERWGFLVGGSQTDFQK